MASIQTIWSNAVKADSSLTLKLPFVSNKKDLVPGALLVLPFDDGDVHANCEAFPLPGATEKWAMSHELS